MVIVVAEFKEVDDQDVVAETFVTLSKLSVRNEFCQQLLDCGGVALIFESLSNHIQNQVGASSNIALHWAVQSQKSEIKTTIIPR